MSVWSSFEYARQKKYLAKEVGCLEYWRENAVDENAVDYKEENHEDHDKLVPHFV